MTRQIRCLVIEDSLHDQKMIKRTLAHAGVLVDTEFAATLEEARLALATGDFAVILCDNNLPDGSGVELAQELAGQSAYRDTAIAVVSGWPSPFMWAKAKAAGLQIIDKNDQPQAKLLEMLKRRLKPYRPAQTT